MATPAVDRNVPAPINTDLPFESPTPRSTAASPINPKYVTPSTATFKLDKPNLLKEADFDSINLKPDNERKFWKSTYTEASKTQNLQKLGWIVFESQFLDPGKGTQYQEMAKTHTDYRGSYKRSFKTINQSIKEFNVKSSGSPNFGRVRAFPPCQPALLDQKHWDILNDGTHVDTLAELEETYATGFAIQKYYTVQTEDPQTFTNKVERGLQRLIENLNADIDLLELDKKFQTENFGYLALHADDNEPAEPDDSMNPEPGPEPNQNTGPIQVPTAIQAIRAELGGNNGILQHILVSLANGQPVDEGVWKKFEEVQERVKNMCLSIKLLSNQFDINLQQINVMNTGIQQVLTLYEKLKADLGNKAFRLEYDQCRTAAADFVREKQYPENFLDALAPSFPKEMLDDFDKKAAEAADIPTQASPETLAILATTLGVIMGVDGDLSKYLHSSATGGIDVRAQQGIERAATMLQRICMDAKEVLPQHYMVDKDSLRPLFIIVSNLQALERKASQAPTDLKCTEEFLNACSEIDLRVELIPGLHAALIGHLRDSYIKKATPLPIPIPIADGPIRTLRARGAVDPGHIMSSDSRPGYIVEEIAGEEYETMIESYRKVGFGFQLMITYDRKGFSKPSYEWIAASSCKGAREDFMAIQGSKFVSGAKTDLAGLTWSAFSVIGVCTVRRDPEETYMVKATHHIRLQNKKTKNTGWYNMSNCINQFGSGHMERIAGKYMRQSGQVVPKKPVNSLIQKQLIRLENEKRAIFGKSALSEMATADNKGGNAVSRAQAAKIKKRIMREYEFGQRGVGGRRVQVDEDDEGEGEDIGDDEDADENGDLRDFVVPDSEWTEEMAELEKQEAENELKARLIAIKMKTVRSKARRAPVVTPLAV